MTISTVQQPENAGAFKVEEQRKNGDPGDAQPVMAHQQLINAVKAEKKKQKKPGAEKQGRNGFELAIRN